MEYLKGLIGQFDGDGQLDNGKQISPKNDGEEKLPEYTDEKRTVNYLGGDGKSKTNEASAERGRIKIIFKRKSPGEQHSVNVVVGATSEKQSVNESEKAISYLSHKNSLELLQEAESGQTSLVSRGSLHKDKHGSVSMKNGQVLKKPKLEEDCRLFGVGLLGNTEARNHVPTTLCLKTEAFSGVTEESKSSAYVQGNFDSSGHLDMGFHTASTDKANSIVTDHDGKIMASAVDPLSSPNRGCLVDEHINTFEEEVVTELSCANVGSSHVHRFDLRPKARRTPLAFPSATLPGTNGATRVAFSSSVIRGITVGNSAPLPAKRSPLPLPVAGSSLSFPSQASPAESSADIGGLHLNSLEQDLGDQRPSIVQTRLQSLSSCQSTSTALELASTVSEVQRIENEFDTQSIAGDTDIWISPRCLPEDVKQEPKQLLCKQIVEIDEHVRNGNELEVNKYLGENDPIQVAQSPLSRKPELVAQALPNQDHMILQLSALESSKSALESSNGEGIELPRFSFQRLINGDISDLEDDDEEEDDSEEFVEGLDEVEDESNVYSAGWNPLEQHPEKTREPDADMPEKSESQQSDDMYYGREVFSSQRLQSPRSVPYACSKHTCNHETDTDVEMGSNTSNQRLVSESSASPSKPGSSCRSPHKQTSSEMSDDLFLLPRQTTSPSGIKLKIKISKEVAFKEVPGTAKTLLTTGLLEGHRVRYLDRGGGVMLTGVVQNCAILCDCRICKGENIVNVSGFEKHAGSTARHPSDFIFIENGKSLRDILEAGWQAAEGKAVEALREAINSSGDDTENDSCLRCGSGGGLSQCRKENCTGVAHPDCAGLSNQSNTGWLCSRCGGGKYQGRPEPIAFKSGRGPQLSQTRDMSLHKLVFLPGGLPDGTDLAYYVKGQHILDGVKRGPGICCSCCSQVISCSQFEAHAGWGSRRNPYNSIYLSDGQSLHDVAIALAAQKNSKLSSGRSTRRNFGDNEDFCAECGDGGDLVLCDGCPRAYHTECAGIPGIPDGDWFCPLCQGQVGTERNSSGKTSLKGGARISNLPAKEKFIGRCQRVVKASENTVGGCVLCRNGDFLKSGFGAKTIMLCDQCEREYHVGCMKEKGLADLKELPAGEWFCGADCKRIHKILQVLVLNGPEPVHSSILSRLSVKQQQKNLQGQASESTLNITWQLLHGRRGNPENGRVLSEAAALFVESFDPIIDAVSGRDLISLMVYSRSIRDQDFRGMYCAVLKCNEAVVSAAIIRVFGRQLAEMPLVATKFASRGQGYYQMLHLCIERLLGVLQVKHLILPAAEGAEGIWANKFGFSKLQDEQLDWFRTEVQTMIFQGSSMMLKAISPEPVVTRLSRKRDVL